MLTRTLFTELRLNGTTLIGEWAHEKGGTTLGSIIGFSSSHERGGNFLHVRRRSHEMESVPLSILGNGVKQMMESATRFSAKGLE